MGGERDRDREWHKNKERHGDRIDSGTRDGTIGEETMTMAATLTLVVGVVRGSSGNTDGTTTGAVSCAVIE